MAGVKNANRLSQLPLDLDRDQFLGNLIRELAATLEGVVGTEEASGFISVVGQNIGRELDQSYRSAMRISSLTREQVAQVLVDLKNRIQGQFFVISEDEEKIVLGNKACPFGKNVVGHESICMMTSNVFGSITAENLGYAKVELQATIASGAARCRIVVYLKPTPEAENAKGREYFQGEPE